MAGIHVYFGDECLEIIRRMERGELSKICQKAIHDWNTKSNNLEIIEKQARVISEEQKILDAKSKFINKKLNDLNIKHKKEMKEKENVKKEFIEIITKVHSQSREWGLEMFEKYWKQRLKIDKTMNQFIAGLCFKKLVGLGK